MAVKKRHELSLEELEIVRYKSRIARNKSYRKLSDEQREYLRLYARNRYQQNKEYIKEQLKQAKIKRKLKDPIKYNTLKSIQYYKRREPNNKEIKVAVLKMFDLYGRKCLACGSVEDITIDHIKPIVKGGITVLDNLQPLCRSCNATKGINIIDYRIKQQSPIP